MDSRYYSGIFDCFGAMFRDDYGRTGKYAR